jgi:predicted GIY-YIG superfamily endonuclease
MTSPWYKFDMRPNKDEYFTYVLSLGGGNIYVGCTTELERRINRHMKRSKASSIWVKTHGALSVLEVRPGGRDVEMLTTLEYMKSHGYKKVRGHVWVSLQLNYDPSKDRLRAPPSEHLLGDSTPSASSETISGDPLPSGS